MQAHPSVQMWIERLSTMSPEEYFQSLRDSQPMQTYQRWSNKAQGYWNTIQTNKFLAPVRDMCMDMYNQVNTPLLRTSKLQR